jgi:hypothetical protein
MITSATGSIYHGRWYVMEFLSVSPRTSHLSSGLYHELTIEENQKIIPLTCHGHSRPITHLSFSSVVENDQYYLISASKGKRPVHQ